MAAPARFAWSFRDVAVYDPERVYLISGHDELAKENTDFSQVTRWIDSWGSRCVDIAAVSICIVMHPERNVVVIAPDGQVVRWGTTDFSTEHVDDRDDGPRACGHLREVRTIGLHAYAVGMSRMVYRCRGEADWVRIDHGVRADPAQEDQAGFNSIDGFGENELYAAGWNGELWQFDGKTWQQRALPTTLALHKVLCAPDGIVYLLGQNGSLLRGRHDAWEVIEHGVTADSFWGACWFRDQLYASTARGLFVLEGEPLQPSLRPLELGKFGKNRSDCFYRLSAVDECIWSAGEKMLIRSTDGVNWTELPYS